MVRELVWRFASILGVLRVRGRQASCWLAVQVKTRLQSEGKHTSADRRYTGSVDAVKRIWQTEGAQGTNETVMPSLKRE